MNDQSDGHAATELVHLDRVVAEALQPPSELAEKDAAYYARKAYAENTYLSYRSDLRDFVAWAGMRNPFPTTAAVIIRYLVDRAETLAPTTLDHRVAALSFIHRMLGYSDPTQEEGVAAVLRGIKKDRVEQGWEQDQAPAFTLDQIVAMVRAPGRSLHDLRDRAYILTGVFGAFRQSELTGLTVNRFNWSDPRGVVVEMGVTKQDQLAEQRPRKVIPKGPAGFCPVTALEEWLYEAGIERTDPGPVFRGINRHGQVATKPLSHTTTNRIIKKWAARAGIENPEQYSGHSLRASFVTVARALRIPDHVIARQSHHRDLRTLDTYDRPGMAFESNPAMDVMTEFARVLDSA